MREFTRCVAWATGLGALAFALAVATNLGLAQAEGMRAWAVLAVYAPFHALVHLFHADLANWHDDSVFLGATVVAEFLYFFAIVFLVRYAWRHRRRARR